MNKIESSINKISNFLGKIVSWFTSILVLVVVYDVISRYFFGISSTAVQEITWHIFSIIFLLGASYTLKEEGHVRVDLFYQKYSEKTKAVVNLIGTLIFIVPFSLVVIITSVNWTINSFMMNEVSPDPGGLGFRFLIKAVLPLSFIFLLLQSFSLMINSINKIRRT